MRRAPASTYAPIVGYVCVRSRTSPSGTRFRAVSFPPNGRPGGEAKKAGLTVHSRPEVQQRRRVPTARIRTLTSCHSVSHASWSALLLLLRCHTEKPTRTEEGEAVVCNTYRVRPSCRQFRFI